METTTDMIDKIEGFMLESFAEQGWADTPEHRLWFLEGLRNGWAEDVETDPDLAAAKQRWMTALDLQIVLAKIKTWRITTS